MHTISSYAQKGCYRCVSIGTRGMDDLHTIYQAAGKTGQSCIACQAHSPRRHSSPRPLPRLSLTYRIPTCTLCPAMSRHAPLVIDNGTGYTKMG